VRELIVQEFHETVQFFQNSRFAAAEVVQTSGNLLHSVAPSILMLRCAEFPVEQLAYIYT
jgi:hypothetical protein